MALQATAAYAQSAAPEWPPGPDEWLPLQELCERARALTDFPAEQDLSECAVRRGVNQLGLVTARSIGHAEYTQLLVVRRQRGKVSLVAVARTGVNTGGSHSSAEEGVGIRSLGPGVLLAELTSTMWFAYPHVATTSEHRTRLAVVCRPPPEAACTHPFPTGSYSDETPTTYPWAALAEDWWTHRLAPGQGDGETQTRLSLEAPGLLRVDRLDGGGPPLRHWAASERLDDPSTHVTYFVRFGTPASATAAVPADIEIAGRPPPEYSGMEERGTLAELCRQISDERVRCAIQPLSAPHFFLLAESNRRRVVFLGRRSSGSELVLLARVVDRPAVSDGLRPLTLVEKRPLPGGRLGWVVEDVSEFESRRYMLVCERRRRLCVARVPLRRIARSEPAIRDGQVVPEVVATEMAEATIDGDVLTVRRISGSWADLYDGEQESPSDEQETIAIELPVPP